ncbi:MAG: FixH family protein [Myxococcales bacterium]|nr:FixH family protein [Myxococcales bacterium]
MTADPTATPHRGSNSFSVHVRTLGGQPVTGATLDVLATMPAHAHEAPAPHVTDKGGGLYVVDDVIFSMAGLWQLRVVARAAQGSDGKTFQYEVP